MGAVRMLSIGVLACIIPIGSFQAATLDEVTYELGYLQRNHSGSFEVRFDKDFNFYVYPDTTLSPPVRAELFQILRLELEPFDHMERVVDPARIS